MHTKRIVIILVALVVVALCVGVSLYAPNLVELIKRMHGG